MEFDEKLSEQNFSREVVCYIHPQDFDYVVATCFYNAGTYGLDGPSPEFMGCIECRTPVPVGFFAGDQPGLMKIMVASHKIIMDANDETDPELEDEVLAALRDMGLEDAIEDGNLLSLFCRDEAEAKKAAKLFRRLFEARFGNPDDLVAILAWFTVPDPDALAWTGDSSTVLSESANVEWTEKQAQLYASNLTVPCTTYGAGDGSSRCLCPLSKSPSDEGALPTGAGLVYIMFNPSLGANRLKIGMTTGTAEKRAEELSSGTGVPTPFIVAYEARVRDCRTVERLIHEALATYRVSARREFFDLPLKTAVEVVSRIVAEQ